MAEERRKAVAVIGAGVFGLSLAFALRKKGHSVTVFDKQRYDVTGYVPSRDDTDPTLAASVDHNKIFRASYGTKIHYQHLALEARERWLLHNSQNGCTGADDRFVPSGMLRVQPGAELGALERETLANLERDGLRSTQFVKGLADDQGRAQETGWANKLLEFGIPDDRDGRNFEAVLDSLAGFTRCCLACADYYKLAVTAGVVFHFGPETGEFREFIEEQRDGRKKVIGLRTTNGQSHFADTVVVAAGSFSIQVLPDLSYHMESSAGSIAAFRIAESDVQLWNKYGPQNFPVMTWKSAPRNKDGKDTGSVYVLPRTPEGLVKIGYRGIKFTNFERAPEGTPFTQDGKWSVPMPAARCRTLPRAAVEAIRQFVEIFLPDFKHTPFYSTQLCWYTDTLDNSFLIDYVPSYADNSVFVCTGGSGHGAKFMTVLGEHAADIFDNGDKCSTTMRPFWRWREDAPRKIGLEEGPGGTRSEEWRRALLKEAHEGGGHPCSIRCRIVDLL